SACSLTARLLDQFQRAALARWNHSHREWAGRQGVFFEEEFARSGRRERRPGRCFQGISFFASFAPFVHFARNFSMNIDPYILAFSAITVIATIFVGFWSAKKSKTASDFFVAGRSVSVGW